MRVVSLALNLPGPAACMRLRELGAEVLKVEPPSGDPMQHYCPAWYEELHRGIPVKRLDLKDAAAQGSLAGFLDEADVLVTAQRPAALARLGLTPEALRERHPHLCVVRILGHPAPHEDIAGHDLTYQAMHGLIAEGRMPPSLFADMCGAERVASTALALVQSRGRAGAARHADVALEEAAAWLALPLRWGLTAPGALLGGGLPGYHLYRASDGWIAVAALEPHFAQRLAEALGIEPLDTGRVAARFATDSAAAWERWAHARDLPIVAVRAPSTHHKT